MTSAAPADRDAAVLRRQCICQEDPANGPCARAQPVTRQHARWLRAYAARHPERVIIMSETTGTWMSALLAHLPRAPTTPSAPWPGCAPPATCPRPPACGRPPASGNCSTCSAGPRPPRCPESLRD